MKFLCLTLCQGEVCTDASADTNNNDDARSIIVEALWLINQMSQTLYFNQISSLCGIILKCLGCLQCHAVDPSLYIIHGHGILFLGGAIIKDRYISSTIIH